MVTNPQTTQIAYLTPEAMSAEVDSEDLRSSVRRPIRIGVAIIALIFCAFGGWAATAPLAGGAVAPGVISPDSSRKTVQHLEGGIISEIMVRDGDKVTADQILLALEDTQARAAYEVLLHQSRTLKATQARLVSEQLNRDDIDFPKDLIAAANEPEVRDVLDVQRQLFITRNAAVGARKRVLKQKILQLQEQEAGYRAQFASADKRLRIVSEELKAKEFLLQKELLRNSEVLSVRRAWAQIEGDRGEYQAAIARAKQQIGEAELELVSLDADRAKEIVGDLESARSDLAKVTEQLGASEDKLKRTTIDAPVAGTVVNLHFKTRGGVIKPGEAILDIVPADDDLLIDARVAPNDIDVVHAGLSAKVHLSAFTMRSLPQIFGRVRSVSADSLKDERTGTSYYLARVEVDREQLDGLGLDIHLVPGMPAEVLIVTGERTLFGYLLQPFRDIFRRSLREA